MFKNIPFTKIKIKIAGIMYRIVRVFYSSDIQQVNRNNVNYELDLSEGIDFSVFMFGNFQKYIFGKGLINLKENSTIIDVGANIGNMSLQFANTPNCSMLYAFEPTDYAYPKLIKNIELNPNLKDKIQVFKSFVSDDNSENSEIEAYSSWKIGNKQENAQIHPLHLGSISTANETPSVKIDTFVEKQKIKSVELIKIDTDGHEYKVIKGALETIKKFKPYVIFEAGLYIMEEHSTDFTSFLDLFEDQNCRFIDMKSKKIINKNNYKEIIPHKSTTDILIVFDN